MSGVLLRLAALPVLAHLPMIFLANLALLSLAWLLAVLVEGAAARGAAAFAMVAPMAVALLGAAITAYAQSLPGESGGWRRVRLVSVLWGAGLAPPAVALGWLAWGLVRTCLSGAAMERILAAIALGGVLPVLLAMLWLLPAIAVGGGAWRRAGLMVFRHGRTALLMAGLAMAVTVLSAGLLPGLGGGLMLLRAAMRASLDEVARPLP